MAYVLANRSSALWKSYHFFFANVSMWQGRLTVCYLTLRMKILRPCSPSIHQDLWDTTACVSRASRTPCSLAPLLPPLGRWRGVQL